MKTAALNEVSGVISCLDEFERESEDKSPKVALNPDGIFDIQDERSP